MDPSLKGAARARTGVTVALTEVVTIILMLVGSPRVRDEVVMGVSVERWSPS